MATHLLLETSIGYALFSSKGFEEIGAKSAQVQETLTSLNSFSKLVSLISFIAFKDAAQALENINDVSEGVLNDLLLSFLQQNLPGTKTGLLLGLAEKGLAGGIKSAVGINCDTSERSQDLIRGLRLHADKLIPGLQDGDLRAAQLGLGHAYSRAKVKFNVNRSDNMIIQAIAMLDQLDKDVNTFAMRVREWYGWHFPELVKIVPDNYQYAQLVHLIGDKAKLNTADQDSDLFHSIVDIVKDEPTARSVLEAAKTSMGQDISPIDLINIANFSSRVIHLYQYRTSLQTYLNEKMNLVAPNLGALVGDVVAARLISHAGSLTNLSKYPASTVQILGAEKALFRALKTKGNTPKYGLIYHSTFIGRAVQKNKGRISRFLANKCSIASRIDCFADSPSTKFGEALRDQVEERLAFYETGSNPTKNSEAMAKVLAAMKAEAITAQAVPESAEAESAPKKKSKKRKSEAVQEPVAVVEEAQVEQIAQEMQEEQPKKKKKKSKDVPKVADTPVSALSAAPPSDAMDIDPDTSIKKAKKDKKKRDAKAIVSETTAEAKIDLIEPAHPAQKAEKKKKSKKSRRSEGAESADVSMNL